MNLNDYFEKIICINRDIRQDRWAHFTHQCDRYGFSSDRFRAHEGTMPDGSFNGNLGCTASHRGVLELIAHHGWERTLIFEDDVEVVEPGRYGDHAKGRLPFQQQWEQIVPEIPDDWDMLYLGGHYGSPPISRVSPHIIRIASMLTTSSYAVSRKFAYEVAPHIHSGGPIDSRYSEFMRFYKCYCVQPRLFVQYTNVSDLQHREMENAQCMLDPNHEAMV